MPGIREKLGHALFLKVAGPDGAKHRDRIHGTPGERWFEPGSPIGRVHGDAAMFVGGLRAVLLQTLHPKAMRAVAEHSGYRGDMWGRLARTSRFLAVTTFGTADDAQQAVDIVRSIHVRVTGTMDDGTSYSADDPHLLLWVHVAEIESFLLAHQTYGAEPLDQAGRDEYVAQTAEIARRLGVVDPPTTEAGLAEVMASFRPELRVTPEAREAVSHLVWRPALPIPARPAYGVLVAAAVGMMPAWTRRPLRLPWLPVSGPVVTRTLGTLATATIRWALTPPPAASLRSGEARV
ncbi:MAG: oxygenase MpaB family protein [Nocardioides sp.]